MSASAVPIPWIIMVIVPLFGLFFGLLSISELLVGDKKFPDE